MMIKSGRTRQRTNSIRDEMIWRELCQVAKDAVSFRQ